MCRSPRRAAGVLTALALLAACSDDPAAPLPPGPDEVPAAVQPAQQWAGGDVTLTWSWLVGQEGLPEFRVADSILAAARLDDSTVALALPHLSSGIYAIEAAVDAARIELAQVAVFGYTSSAPAPWLASHRPWPSVLGTEVIGVHFQEGDTIGTVQILDLATGALRGTGFPHARGNADEVGLSYRPGVAVIFNHDHSTGADTRVRYWHLDPGPLLLDSLGWDGDYNKVYEFGPDQVLLHHNGDYEAIWPGGYWYDETGTGRVVIAPDWQRAILFQGHNPLAGSNEIFMFDGLTGRPGYTLPAYRRLIHGAFTPDGMTAYLAVTRQEDPDEAVTVIRVDAATGSLQATTTLPTTYGDTHTTVSVVGGRVIVLFREADQPGFTLRVLRAQGLEMEAELRLPAATGGWWAPHPEVASPLDGSTLYLLTFASTGSTRHRLDLLPE